MLLRGLKKLCLLDVERILICIFGVLCLVLIVILIVLIIIVCVARQRQFQETVDVNDIEAKKAEKIQVEKTRADRAKSAAEREDAKKAEERTKTKAKNDEPEYSKNRDNFNDDPYFPSSISGSYYDRPIRPVNYMPPATFANPRPAYQGPYGSREELLEKEAEIRRMYRDMNSGFGVQSTNSNPMHYTSNAATYSDYANPPAPARQAQRKWYLQ